MKRLIFAILICCCFFGLTRRAVAVDCPPPGTGNTATETNYYGYSDSAAALAACQLVRSQKLALGGNCSGCTADSGDYYFLHYHVSLYLPASYHQYRFVYCNDLTDTDGDGIPDSQDPCPQNPNPDCTDPNGGDGDGIPDSEDPCPQNPNPNCTDPDNPPPDIPPPEIPDDIIIGPCAVDITNLKAWILSEDSFPFNFIYRIYSITSPLFFMEPEAPVIETAIPLDPSGQYSWIPDTYPITIDFEFLNPIAVCSATGNAWHGLYFCPLRSS
ncbi:MAG: thrombospondin type 3 repeat-containing protein [Candidatus Electronema sp. V4]|uniref:thrombospondin type 3 repeat-containing protein n=1 Tax=Candidatus Electronema sp. V4 TaxID=3454756 RepID=UPI004055459B